MVAFLPTNWRRGSSSDSSASAGCFGIGIGGTNTPDNDNDDNLTAVMAQAMNDYRDSSKFGEKDVMYNTYSWFHYTLMNIA
jgi:hypothetical protein